MEADRSFNGSRSKLGISPNNYSEGSNFRPAKNVVTERFFVNARPKSVSREEEARKGTRGGRKMVGKSWIFRREEKKREGKRVSFGSSESSINS